MVIEVQPDPLARRWEGFRTFFAISIGLGLVIGFVCWRVTGAELDLFLAPLAFVCLIAPPLAAIVATGVETLLVSGGLTLGTTLIWIVSSFGRTANAGQLFRCAMALYLFIAVLASLVFLLRSVLPSLWPASITSFAGLAWLTWPFWASQYVGTSVHWLVILHPLFAMNSAVASLGIWTEQPIAYGLTTLGQDVAYTLPGSIWPCGGFELAMTVPFLTIAEFIRRRRRVIVAGLSG